MGNVDEDKLVNKEKNILEIARESWRMHNVSALEIFADIQHHGGVTRLLDVTLNPYVATWFAVESDKHEGYDARIFAISKDSENADPQTIENLKITDKDLRAKDPFWHAWVSKDRELHNWGTGDGRRIWVPPTYNNRILAQNAAFLIDGVPRSTKYNSSYFAVKHPKNEKMKNNFWKIRDIRSSSSIPALLYNLEEGEEVRKKNRRQKTGRKRNLAPTFTFRIKAEAKSEIRRKLENVFGYISSVIYPDILGLSIYSRSQIYKD